MKKAIIIGSVTLTVLLLALLVCFCLIPVFHIGTSQKNNAEVLLTSSSSPDGKYNLKAYRTESGATVDFSVKVYSVNGGKKELIYNDYHQQTAEIVWADNARVSINGQTLDLSKGEKYDWRKG